MIKSRWKWGPLGVTILLAAFAISAGSAAADPASELSAAESRTAGAEAAVAAARRKLDAARADYAATSQRARPAAAAARAARAEMEDLTLRQLERQLDARAEIHVAEESHRLEEEEHDDEVATGIGIGLALFAAAAIALAWGRLRASSAVSVLVGMRQGRAAALCVAGGFLLFLAGGVLESSGGAVVALGGFLSGLGLVMPVALLLGRRSKEIERGGADPASGRERMSDSAPRAAALLFVLGLVLMLGAISSDEPSAPSISAQQREEARPFGDDPAAALEEAEAKATKIRRRAAPLLARQRAARVELRTATSAVRRAKARLVAAEADERRSARRLAALVAREEREAERQAEREAEEAEEIEFFEEEEAAAGCDPNYSGCVPPYPPDVDCAEVGGSVTVYDSDPHGLDADGDGVGCE